MTFRVVDYVQTFDYACVSVVNSFIPTRYPVVCVDICEHEDRLEYSVADHEARLVWS